MSGSKRSKIIEVLASAVPDKWIEAQGKALGVVQRRRKVDLVALVTVLILGQPPSKRRSLEGLRRAFELAAGARLARSSFHDRFTPQLATLIRLLALKLAERLASATCAQLRCAIEGVCNIFAIDATVFAGHKLHAVTNVVGTGARRVKLTDKDTHDVTVWKRIGKWVKGHLLIMDLGYYDFHLFWRIHQQGGFFLSRAKTNFNPTIVSSNRTHRGRAIAVKGAKLQDVLERMQRQVFDLTVEVVVNKRKYRGKRSRVQHQMRLVGIWNEAAGRYHMYLTNLGPDALKAEVVGEVYRLRWQVELMWMSLKSEGRLDQIPTNKASVFNALMWSSLAYVLAGRTLLNWLRERISGEQWVSTRLFERVFETIRLIAAFELLADRRRSSSSDDPLLDFVFHELRACSQPPATPFTTVLLF